VSAGIVLAWPACRAVLFKSTGDPTYNTTAPGGTLTNSGWQYQGQWGGFLGTPIAPTYFLAAKHVSGYSGMVFNFGGSVYHIGKIISNPAADLVVCHVAETFPQYAPLYTNSDEVGKHCVVFGRGTQRGAPVIVSKATNGWAWGASDGVQRWGENDVYTNLDEGAGLGQQLVCTFDSSGSSNECQLSVGDSSGAMFIQDGSTWKLAAIHYAVSNPWISTNGVNGSGFNAAMLDYFGVYVGGDSNWVRQTQHYSAAFFSTRVSANLAWISSVIDLLPGDDLQITSIFVVNSDIEISFATGSNKLYGVESRDSLTSGSWTNLTNGIVGTGGIMTYTDVGAATLSNRFYRLVLVP
jgi:hypothetical protein